MDLTPLARGAAILGIVFLVLAGIIFLAGRLGLPLGRLPGDLVFKRENFTCAVPLVSSLIISVLLTLFLNLVLYFLRK